MSENDRKEIIRRRTDGSIDINFYATRGLRARRELVDDTLRFVPKLIATSVRTIAFRLRRTGPSPGISAHPAPLDQECAGRLGGG
jgi:hypothetical protein